MRVRPVGGGTIASAVANCTRTCVITADVPVGLDEVTVLLFDRENGTGNLLAQGSATANVLARGSTDLAMGFNGVPAAVSMSLPKHPTAGIPVTVHFSVSVEDADGNAIVAPGKYPTIALSNDDATGTVRLKSDKVTAPGTIVEAVYNGGWIRKGNASANITAKIEGTKIEDTLAISPQPALKTFRGVTSSPEYISMTAGPDGALWFVELYRELDRITTAGAITRFPAPSGVTPGGLAVGPDKAIWFADDNGPYINVGRMTTSGVYSECASKEWIDPIFIQKGSDGNMWYVGGNVPAMGRETVSCGETVFALPGTYPHVQGMTLGPDGSMWITEDGYSSPSYIGRMTPSGHFTRFAIPASPSQPIGIAGGPDGYLWFVDNGTGQIGHVSTKGAIAEFPREAGSPPAVGNISLGPDGAMWFSTRDGMGRISLKGQQTYYSAKAARADNQLYSPVLGPDNALWGIIYSNGDIGRLSI